MNIEKLYADYSIDFVTEGKNYREGWINTRCPFCDDHSEHLGYSLDDNYFSCFRCGHHFVDDTISKLLGVNLAAARKIIKTYDGETSFIQKEPKVITRAKAFKLPSGVDKMETMHRIYLDKRGFDPEQLEKDWGLLGSGPVSILDELNYRFRIIIPFYWDDKIVSFDSRDITGKHKSRYMACPKERELIPHKEILYGRQDKWKETGILVEGPTDVWRMGTSSCAVSGIKYTPKQVRLLTKIFKRIAIMFDDDPQAKIQANKIVAELKFRGVDAFRVDIKGDPGGMKQSDADYLIKQLIT
jgi:hypothetical protein